METHTIKLSITGIGMVTSVGFDAVHSAAAIRVGFHRFSPIESIPFYDDDDIDMQVNGAPVSILTRGFVQQARWMRLAHRALEDIMQTASLNTLDAFQWGKTQAIWLLPHDIDAFDWPDDETPSLLQQYFVQPLSQSLALPITSTTNDLVQQGATGFAAHFAEIEKRFANNQCTRVICLAVDSLLEPRILQALLNEQRVKTAAEKSGLIPGEAAVALMIEPAAIASERGSTTGATLLKVIHQSVAIDRDDKHWRNNAAFPIGRALAQAIEDACRCLPEQPFVGDLYLDLNGEDWRAKVWSSAQIILQQKQLIDWDACQEIIPGTSLGDIGAASALVHTALAVRSFTEQYARTDFALVASISDNGDVGVVLLRK
ncbi:MAG: hypothetical protein OEZ58_11990 [Gammaproteobacteria bacterium]|nr:hypothetical protein [Gammaproteobacteria bacterium]